MRKALKVAFCIFVFLSLEFSLATKAATSANQNEATSVVIVNAKPLYVLADHYFELRYKIVNPNLTVSYWVSFTLDNHSCGEHGGGPFVPPAGLLIAIFTSDGYFHFDTRELGSYHYINQVPYNLSSKRATITVEAYNNTGVVGSDSVEVFVVSLEDLAPTVAVGGFWIPFDKFSVLAPYIVLAVTILLAVSMSVVYIKTRKKQ